MARIGLYPSLIIVAFGVVAPFFIFRLGRLIGSRRSSPWRFWLVLAMAR